MAKITVPVLWGDDNNFLNSALYSVDKTSVVVGAVMKPTRIFPPADNNPTLQSVLQIRDADLGTLYLNMTLDAYQALANAVPVGQNGYRLEFTVGDPGFPDMTTEIQSDELIGANIVAISIGGVDTSFVGIDFGRVSSEGRIIMLNILILGDVYIISYFK